MKTKKTVSFFLAFLLLFVSLITSLFEVTFSATKTTKTIEASAEETTDYASLKQMDKNFEWIEGASVLIADPESDPELDEVNFAKKLRFNFHPTDIPNYRFNHEDDYSIFYFTVCRVTNKKYVPIYQVMLYCMPHIILTGYKKLEIDGTEASDVKIEAGDISFYPEQKFNVSIDRETIDKIRYGEMTATELETNQAILYYVGDKVMESFGYTFESATANTDSKIPDPLLLTDETDPTPNSLGIVVNINSFDSEYCVVSKYKLCDFDHIEEHFWWWQEDEIIYDTVEGELKSSNRSVKGVLQRIEEAGQLEEIFHSETLIKRVNYILGNIVDKDITLSYLQQIGKSPFACRVEKRINVPVFKDKVFYDDVCNVLGVDTLNLLGATVNAIEFSGSSSYEVRYLSSVRVEAKTVDGNLKDYFLRLEKSLDSYYRQYVEDGVFEEALIEYMLNDAKLRHPELTGYEAYEIYGLWGYVVVPETNSFNSLFADVFNKPTNFSGTYFHFASHDTLSLSEYNTLLETYDYGWITRIWESAKEYMVGDWTHECTHYLFYADPKYEAVNVGENGGDLGETGGAIKETVKDGVEEIRNSIEENASWWRWTKAIIAIVGVGAGALGVVYVLVKIGVIGGANGSAKTKPKKKKK